jgi:hypothetical protein
MFCYVRQWIDRKAKTYLDEVRYRMWRTESIAQHSVRGIENVLRNLYNYTSIKLGDIKKGEGDIVIIDLDEKSNPFCPLKEYLSHTHHIGKIETKGIYTNIYWSDKFYQLTIEEILKKPLSSLKIKWRQAIVYIYVFIKRFNGIWEVSPLNK